MDIEIRLFNGDPDEDNIASWENYGATPRVGEHILIYNHKTYNDDIYIINMVVYAEYDTVYVYVTPFIKKVKGKNY